MSEFGIKIKNISAGMLYDVNLGIRDYFTYTDAMFNNSLFSFFLQKNGLNIYKGESALKPLGSVEYPFISFVEGNNITLANFEINGSGFCDIGVFGYVGEGGGANNLYFDN